MCYDEELNTFHFQCFMHNTKFQNITQGYMIYHNLDKSWNMYSNIKQISRCESQQLETSGVRKTVQC